MMSTTLTHSLRLPVKQDMTMTIVSSTLGRPIPLNGIDKKIVKLNNKKRLFSYLCFLKIGLEVIYGT